jgi:hypothetical protein
VIEMDGRELAAIARQKLATVPAPRRSRASTGRPGGTRSISPVLQPQ